jgi:predicted nucleic acid-binding protein
LSGHTLPDPADEANGSATPPVRPILVPDAGVGVKWFVPEPDAEAAARLLDARFELHVPSYFFIEAASVFQRKVAVERTLSEVEALEAFRLLHAVPMTVHATEGLLEEAVRHGIRYRRPVYDSLYMVLALALGGRVVTADRRLYNGVHGGPLDHLVLWVTDPLPAGLQSPNR